MAIMISSRHLYVQFVDDARQMTLASASSLSVGAGNPTVERARALGRTAAGAALAAGIRQVVVDRGGFKFHGRVKALVEGAVEGGLRVRAEEAQPGAAGGGARAPGKEES